MFISMHYKMQHDNRKQNLQKFVLIFQSTIIAAAIAKSKWLPSLTRSAGAKLTTILFVGRASYLVHAVTLSHYCAHR